MNFIRSKIDNKLLHIVHCLDGDNPQERLDIAPEDQFLQLCLLRVNKGRSFRAHKHLWKPPETKSVIAQESWVVIKGSVKVSFYDKDDTLLTTEILNPGDCSVTFEGGHAYEILEEDTVIYEYKTGPYMGQKLDKEFIKCQA